ncbi:MAG: hypothetical protein IJ006_04405 [Lachnospiraceae bacterium]|nr:hypothetical protein [Lachnospiraceae bacterium]
MGKRIGFVGCYSHDIILMLAKIWGCMEKKVLVRDCNKRHILRASVPIPDTISLETEEAEYDGVYFTELQPGKVTDRYAFELIDFGMDADEKATKYCTDWVVITDMLLHHIRQLEECGFSRERTRVCIIRDAFEDICKKDPEVRQLLGAFPDRKEFLLPPNFRDVRNRYVCETSHEYNVSRASPEMQDMIYCIAGMFCTDCSEKDIRRRMKRSERRRYR